MSRSGLLKIFRPFLFAVLVGAASLAWAGSSDSWTHGPPREASFFPIGVWLQSPENATTYRKLGFNLFVGLWDGPTSDQLARLKAAGMMVVCEQNQVALTDPNNDIIVGWMHGDEPDNAQADGHGGYGPPISPSVIEENYRKLVAADPTRPVLLNLGQGVAWDGWFGRGARTNHPEDYAEYLKGCDLASFDIYPVTHDKSELAGKLELVPYGVDRLRGWAGGQKPVWTCIECTHIGNPKVKPTPAQVRSEVWLALIHGARGLIYFAHEFQPQFREAGLLADPEMAGAVGDINRQIAELAPVLNAPAPASNPIKASSAKDSSIDLFTRAFNGATYLFIATKALPSAATFEGLPRTARVAEVLGENRQIEVKEGRFEDEFGPYSVHLYKVK